MNKEDNYKILIVDDEKLALNFLEKLFSQNTNYTLFTAQSAFEGLRIAREIKPDIIISDYYMPEKDGIEFCRDIRNDPELKDIIFILLTAETSVDKKAESLLKGIDDYIEKNISAKVLLGKVKAFLKIKALQNELINEKDKLKIANQQLERNIKEIIAVLLKILEINIPDAKKRADKAHDIARYITEKIGVHEELKKKIIIGAQLHEIGKIGIPEKIVKSNIRDLNQDDLSIYYQFPLIGSLIISTITGYESVAQDIYHELENYDGSGRPDGLMSEEIPLGSKILRLIIFQEELFMSGKDTDEVIDAIRLAINTKLDPIIASHAINYFIENRDQGKIKAINIAVEDLEQGMVIEEDAFSVSGIKVLTKGMRLNERIINIIKDRNISDPIVGGIYISGKI
ncbi:MAG TPA: response regulator [Syntrophorhabdaceae bacterium]|nr:response regulator [Syntrophorhabdaceae bacterium]